MRSLLLLPALALLAGAGPIEHLGSSAPGLPFTPAVKAGGLIFLSGQIGAKPGERQVVPGGIDAEARQALANIETALKASGSSLARVVKCTVFLADMADWPAFNRVYVSVFKPPFPARSALGANGLALGAKVEVECIAAA